MHRGLMVPGAAGGAITAGPPLGQKRKLYLPWLNALAGRPFEEPECNIGKSASDGPTVLNELNRQVWTKLAPPTQHRWRLIHAVDIGIGDSQSDVR